MFEKLSNKPIEPLKPTKNLPYKLKKLYTRDLGWTQEDVKRALERDSTIALKDILQVMTLEEWSLLAVKLVAYAGPELKRRQYEQGHQKGLVTQSNNKIVELDETLQANLSTIYAQDAVNKELAQHNDELQQIALTQQSVLSRIKTALQKIYTKLPQSIRELLDVI